MYKRKIYITLIFFLLCVQPHAQDSHELIADSTVVSPYEEDETQDNEDNIDIMSLVKLNQIPIDESNRTITFFEKNFQEKYKTDPDLQYKKGEGGKSFFQKLKEWIEQFFRLIFGWDKSRKIENSTVIAFRVISVMTILTILFFVVRYMMRYKGRWFFQKKNPDLTIDADDVEQLIKHSDFEELISESEKNGNTRQGIRLYYLWLLKTLKDKGKIAWDTEKTNSDYVSEIKETDLKKNFEYLSYLYDYIWYGEFSINDEEYVRAKNEFLRFLKK